MCGSDPLWWLALPVVLLCALIGVVSWCAAWALRAPAMAADWIEGLGEAPMRALWSIRERRALRRQQAWIANVRSARAQDGDE